MTEKMQAAVPNRDTGGLCLIEVARPRPGAGEVLVAVVAAGMNHADLLHARGRYAQRLRRSGQPDIAGMELAGRVVAVGRGVDPDLVGRRVMAMWPGGYAPYAAVPVDLLLPVPDSLTWHEAAALPMALHTECEALVRLGRAAPGDRVVVTGATSGVGSVGVQLARELGLSVVATSREPGHDDLLRSLGADAVAHDPHQLAELLVDGADVVVDHVGGALFERVQGHLRDGARLVSVGRLDRAHVQVDLAAFAKRRAALIGTTWRSQTVADVAASAAVVHEVALPAVAAGRIRAVLGEDFVLARISDALARLAGVRPPGKLVIACDNFDTSSAEVAAATAAC